jgi:hypothetical protein
VVTPRRGGPASGSLTIVNELICEGDGGGDGGSGGEVTVIKRIINDTRYPTPNVPFQVKVDCDPGPDLNLTLSAPGNLQQSFAVPAGVACQITESPPPTPPKPCKWVTTYPDGRVTTSRGRSPGVHTLTVVNELICEGGGDTGDGGGSGRLRVIKEVVNTTGRPTPPSIFRIMLDCTPGQDFTFSPSAPAGMTQVVAIASGAQCTVSEPVLPGLPKPCEWVRTYPGGQTGGNGSTLIVRNSLSCGPQSAPAGGGAIFDRWGNQRGEERAKPNDPVPGDVDGDGRPDQRGSKVQDKPKEGDASAGPGKPQRSPGG